MAALDNIASELLKSANEADLIYKRTRDQAQRDKAVRLRRIVENLRNITLGASDLNGLSDVAISSPTNAQVLSYNSTTLKWQNTTISTATPTLAQVTTAGNTTTNAINVGDVTSTGVIKSVVSSVTAQFTAYNPTNNFPRAQFQVGQNSSDNNAGLTVAPLFSSAGVQKPAFIQVSTNKNVSDSGQFSGYFIVNTNLFTIGTNKVDGQVAGGVPIAFSPAGVEAMRIQNNGNIQIGTTTDAGYKLDVNGIARVVTRIDAGSFTPGAGASAYTFATTGTITAAGGYNLRSPIYGDSGFSGLGDSGGPTIYSNNATVARFLNIGGALNGTSIDILQGYNPGAGTGSVIGVRHSYALYPSVDNTVSYTSFLSNPYWISAPFYNRITGPIRGFYFANGLYNTQKLVDVIAFESNGGRVVFAGETPSASGGVSRGVYLNQTLTAAANNDVLVGLDINPTFTNGAFTGVTNYALRVSGTISQFTSPGATQIRIEGPSGANKSVFFFNTSSTFANTRIYNTGTTNQFIIATGDATIAPTDRFTIFQTGNVAINSTTDAGYKLDVNGTFRTLVGTETNPFRLEHTNGNYMTMIVGAGSALAAGQFGMYFNGSPMWSWNGAVFRLHNNALSVSNNPNTLLLLGGYGGSTVGTSVKLASNTYNQGQWTATTGAQTTVEIGSHSNEIWAPSSGNASYTLLSVAPRINTTGTYAGIVRGFYYNPILTSVTGVTHRAIETTSGDVIFNGGNVGIGTPTPTDKIHIVDNTNGNKFARISAGGTDASAAWVAQNDQVDNIVYRVFGSAVTGSQMGQALARSASLIANLGGTGKFLIGSYSGTDLIFGTSDQARMRLVDATGNFLIGTMTDNGNKLTVSGDIDAQGYKVNNVLGYTGILNIPTNPPGQQNIDIQGGIVINIF
jgi:hypothetical protein